MAHVHIDHDILILAMLLAVGLAAGYSLVFGFPTLDASLEGELSCSMLLEGGLERADQRFRSEAVSGDFGIESYRWTKSRGDLEPDAIPLKADDATNSLIRFDGRYSDALRGFAFKTYQVEDGSEPMMIYGSALFLGPEPLFEERLSDGATMEIAYDPHPLGFQVLEGCSVLGAYHFQTSGGSEVRVYDLGCSLMHDAW